MAGNSGARTLTPQKMVGSVVDQATSDVSGRPGRIVPWDLSIGGKKDTSIREEDPSGKKLRREPEGRRRIEDRGQRSQHLGVTADGGLSIQPGHPQRRRGDRRNGPIGPQPRRQRRHAQQGGHEKRRTPREAPARSTGAAKSDDRRRRG